MTMKFTFTPEGVTEEGGGIMGWFNNVGDKFVEGEVEAVLKPIGHFIHTAFSMGFEWFVANLPDIMGIGTMAAGAAIILSSMTGSGIGKPLGWFAGAFITAWLILAGR